MSDTSPPTPRAKNKLFDRLTTAPAPAPAPEPALAAEVVPIHVGPPAETPERELPACRVAVAPQSKYTPEIATEIVTLVRGGSFQKHACDAVGVNESTLADWFRKGRTGLEPYAQFLVRVKAAQAACADEGAARIRAAATHETPGDWKAQAWLLERLYSREFGSKKRIEHSIVAAQVATDLHIGTPLHTWLLSQGVIFPDDWTERLDRATVKALNAGPKLGGEGD